MLAGNMPDDVGIDEVLNRPQVPDAKRLRCLAVRRRVRMFVAHARAAMMRPPPATGQQADAPPAAGNPTGSALSLDRWTTSDRVAGSGGWCAGVCDRERARLSHAGDRAGDGVRRAAAAGRKADARALLSERTHQGGSGPPPVVAARSRDRGGDEESADGGDEGRAARSAGTDMDTTSPRRATARDDAAAKEVIADRVPLQRRRQPCR